MAEKKKPKAIIIKKESLQHFILPQQLAQPNQFFQLKSPKKTFPKVLIVKKEELQPKVQSPTKLKFLNSVLSGQNLVILKNDEIKNLFKNNVVEATNRNVVKTVNKTPPKVVYIQKQPQNKFIVQNSVKPSPKQTVIKDFKVTSVAGKQTPRVITIKNEPSDENYVDALPMGKLTTKEVKKVIVTPSRATKRDAELRQAPSLVRHVVRPASRPVVVKPEPKIKVEQIVEEQPMVTEYEEEYLDELLEEQVVLEPVVDDTQVVEVTIGSSGSPRRVRDAEMYHEVIVTEPSAEYECKICSIQFETEQLKEDHMMEEHTFSYECTQCNHRTVNANAARAHFREAHQAHLVYAEEEEGGEDGVVEGVEETSGDGWVMSEDLVATEVLLSQVEEAEQITDGDDTAETAQMVYECHYCFKTLSSERTYRAHVLKHQINQARAEQMVNEERPLCDECDVHFDSLKEWTKHVLTAKKHKDKKRTILNGCRQCGETFPSPNELREHIKAEHPDVKARSSAWTEAQPCSLCGELMESSHKYWAHFRRIHPDEEYPLKQPCQHKCEECGKEFRCRALLKMHMNKHTGVRLFQCSECPKSFFTNLSLRYHQISHSDLRPFKCDTCGRGFKFKAGMERHQLVHTGERPYVCGVCGQGFTTMHWTQLHVRKVHNNEHIPYKPRVRKRRPVVRRAEPAA